MRPLEIVVLHEERDAPLAVVKVREDRSRQKLVPHRLPEALDLSARLRMVRAALHVPDAVATQLLLEARLAAPRGVLPALVRQDLARGAVVRDRARERFHHEARALVMRDRQAHEVPAVVVQKRRDVQPLLTAQKKRKQVRLPELVRLRTLEAPLGRTRLRRGRLAFRQ